jgi:hypothetical protein
VDMFQLPGEHGPMYASIGLASVIRIPGRALSQGAMAYRLGCASVRKCPRKAAAHLGFIRLITVSGRRHSKRRPSIGPKRIRLTSTAGLLDNRHIGVVGVEDVHDIPARPGEYPAQLIRRHHRVVHPRANDVTKTHAYPDLTR